MEENKLNAKMKLMAKNTNGVVVNVGPTWFKALEPEFTKSYFVDVRINYNEVLEKLLNFLFMLLILSCPCFLIFINRNSIIVVLTTFVR